ncbi:hypothetical protein BM477_04300 [Boudabousia marimammalium]|uniref:Phosphatidate cytidylyltransferase n=1 Tax=Boudabousia marimammalium TaxID=156892 RepID=A0A1Q5PPC4_9ACTO|nr:hypothetical protein BM477_04300 [Boudabousia marimammalium]
MRAADAPVPVDAPKPDKQYKGGRDLRAAITVGISLAALFLLSILIHPIGFLGLSSVGCVYALYELKNACARAHLNVAYPVLAVGAVGILTSAYFLGMEAAFISFYAAAGVAIVWHVLANSPVRETTRNSAASVFLLGYVPLLAAFAVRMLTNGGYWAVIVFVLLPVGNDTGGYIAGVLKGKHPMAASISPKKSWEGFAGSIAATITIGTISMHLLGASSWWGVILGIAIAITATTGDLAESLIKRDLGLKDMGSILPGHGGFMDRLDSLLVSAPACYLIMHFALSW